MSEDELVPMSAPFWAAADEERLVLQRCDACQRFVWYPRAVCPHCFGSDLTWTEVTGDGEVYAASVHQKSPRPDLVGPYAVALIELDEGVRLLSQVVDCDPDAVEVGQRVRARWRPQDGRNLLVFAPVPAP